MNKIENLSVEQNKVLEEEQQLLLQVKQGLLMHAAEEKKGEISKSQLENIIEPVSYTHLTLPTICSV